ncbi:hypothetical protein ABMA27_004087 [Loxostege sticticalis]|uniref:Reverse transcriptase domain-containing protein n=1 Tax=Loxostege sticticalis TaxID=481309 RepID=A0ABR3HMA6_LOXSC
MPPGLPASALTHVCDAAMLRAGPLPPKRAVYWWSDEIAQLRPACIAARRESSRHRRRRKRDPNLDTPLYEAYNVGKKALQTAIAKAKTKARQELLETLNRDPWGRPYRAARGKLRPWAPPVMDSLEPSLLTGIVSALFPSRAEHIPPPMRPHSTASSEAPAPVSEGKLGAAMLSLRAKNPGKGVYLWTSPTPLTRCHGLASGRPLCDMAYLVYVDRDGTLLRQRATCGVPQGYVLGPLLWNIGYDWVLRGSHAAGVSVICYADDTLVTASGADFAEASRRATAGVATVVHRIRQLGLEVEQEKSEALCFHGPRRAPPEGSHLVVGGVRIEVAKTLKYLGLVLDDRWGFQAHFKRLVPKLKKAAGALGTLLPNVGGPSA